MLIFQKAASIFENKSFNISHEEKVWKFSHLKIPSYTAAFLLTNLIINLSRNITLQTGCSVQSKLFTISYIFACMGKFACEIYKNFISQNSRTISLYSSYSDVLCTTSKA